MDKFKIFEDISDEKMLELYKDILGSKELGIRPRSLDSYAQQIKEICHFEMLSQATNFVIELFYEEVAMRYFKNMKKCKDCELFKNGCGFSNVDKKLELDGNFDACSRFVEKRIVN